jgi:ABC-type nitrate/sulfonate/bicarbonate transport system substrate-binding protein
MKQCAALVLALALLPAAGSAQAALPVVTMAGPANDTAATFLYAADMGFFTKAGLDVRINVQSNPGTVTAAVAAGALDVGSITVPIVALAYDHNVPLRLIAPSGIYSSDAPTSGLIVLKASAIRQAADLTGKTIGVRDINNMNYYAAKVWIDRHGGNSGSVRFVEIPESQTLEALTAGRIDAAALANPGFYDAVHGSVARLLAPTYDAIAKRFLIGVYFTSIAYAQAHPDIVRKLSAALNAAGAWANANHEQSAKILEKYSGAPVPPEIPRVTYATALRVEDAQPVLDLLYAVGAIHKPIRAADLFGGNLAP